MIELIVLLVAAEGKPLPEVLCCGTRSLNLEVARDKDVRCNEHYCWTIPKTPTWGPRK